MTKKTVLIDQYALTKLGADRGLGRYTSLLTKGVDGLPAVTVSELLPSSLPRFVPEVLRIQFDIKKTGLRRDVPYHATSVYHLPLLKNRPWICSIQDVIALDLTSYRRLGIKSRMLFANSRRSDLIVANSEYTKQRIISTLGVAPEKILTCPLPIAESFHSTPSSETISGVSGLLKSYDIDITRPYVVALADLRTPDPRKRYHWINDLAMSLAEIDVPIVVTGRGLTQRDFASAVVIPALTDDELTALYSRSTAAYYPSAYEGQGLPPQEAMAAGCPVIAYRNTSVQEVVGSENFLFDDPVPWELQSLFLPLPKSSTESIIAKVGFWSTSSVGLTEARQEARKMASQYSHDRFHRDLAEIYAHSGTRS